MILIWPLYYISDTTMTNKPSVFHKWGLGRLECMQTLPLPFRRHIILVIVEENIENSD